MSAVPAFGAFSKGITLRVNVSLFALIAFPVLVANSGDDFAGRAVGHFPDAECSGDFPVFRQGVPLRYGWARHQPEASEGGSDDGTSLLRSRFGLVCDAPTRLWAV